MATVDTCDYYCTYAVHTRKPVFEPAGEGGAFTVLCCLPDSVDTRGNVADDTCYLSLVVLSADFPVLDLDAFFSRTFGGFGIFARCQVGSMRRVFNG